MQPAESIIEYVTLDLLPCKRRMVCQNIFVAENCWNPTDIQILSMTSPWISLLLKLPLLASSVYRDCKSNEDLSCSKALNASFFARIACLTSGFHLGVLLPLSPATLSRFLPQLSAADDMIADLNSSHSFSMSFNASGSCLNLDDILNANYFAYFFVFQSLPFDPRSHVQSVAFRVWRSFKSRKEHITKC